MIFNRCCYKISNKQHVPFRKENMVFKNSFIKVPERIMNAERVTWNSNTKKNIIIKVYVTLDRSL